MRALKEVSEESRPVFFAAIRLISALHFLEEGVHPTLVNFSSEYHRLSSETLAAATLWLTEDKGPL